MFVGYAQNQKTKKLREEFSKSDVLFRYVHFDENSSFNQTESKSTLDSETLPNLEQELPSLLGSSAGGDSILKS